MYNQIQNGVNAYNTYQNVVNAYNTYQIMQLI